MRDPHAILGVARDASPAEIKAAYRRLAWELHPDRCGGDAAKAERMKEVNWAYQQLGDPALDPELERMRQITENAIDFGRDFAQQRLSRHTARLGIAAKPAERFVSELLGALGQKAKTYAADVLKQRPK